MNYRHTKMLAATTLTNATTYTHDLNLTDPVSRITILYKALNGDNVPDGHMAAGVSKIELVDGSEVLYSMSGRQAQATDFYDTGQVPVNGMTYVNANYMWATFNINFGRFLWDQKLALDPKKFNNLQLKITHDYSNCGSSCSASTLAIWGDVFQDKQITPMGFLMNKELYSYTCGAQNSYEYIDIPRDYSIRRMTVFGRYDDYQPWQIAHDIRIDEDNLKQIPVDEATSDLLKTAAGIYGPYEEGILVSVTTSGQTFYCTPAYNTFAVTTSAEDTDTVCNLDGDSYGGALGLEGEGAGEFDVIVRGFSPQGAIPIPFGNEQDLADWYDVRKPGSVQLRIRAGSLGATGTCQVTLQQLRTY